MCEHAYTPCHEYPRMLITRCAYRKWARTVQLVLPLRFRAFLVMFSSRLNALPRSTKYQAVHRRLFSTINKTARYNRETGSFNDYVTVEFLACKRDQNRTESHSTDSPLVILSSSITSIRHRSMPRSKHRLVNSMVDIKYRYMYAQ